MSDATKTLIPNIEKISFWSDGCASQFKNGYVFQDIVRLDSSVTIGTISTVIMVKEQLMELLVASNKKSLNTSNS